MEKWPDLEPDRNVHGNGPAVYYKRPGKEGGIGLISAIHGKFCEYCNRVRLTSRGQLKPCLSFDTGTDLITALKGTDDELKEAITDKTKLLILPFPNNPTGAIMTREELEPIAKIVKEHDLYVISDEIYSELSYKGDHVSIASFPGMKERTLVINGFSKGFAMTGWRLGYVCGPQIIIEQMFKVHQYAIMCAPTNSQYAALVGLQTCMKEVEQMRESYAMATLGVSNASLR